MFVHVPNVSFLLIILLSACITNIVAYIAMFHITMTLQRSAIIESLTTKLTHQWGIPVNSTYMSSKIIRCCVSLITGGTLFLLLLMDGSLMAVKVVARFGLIWTSRALEKINMYLLLGGNGVDVHGTGSPSDTLLLLSSITTSMLMSRMCFHQLKFPWLPSVRCCNAVKKIP